MLPDNIAEKILVADCWEWTAYRHPDGYGRVQVIGGGLEYAHRAVWKLLVGPIPPGAELDHLCRNRACCNPDHLEVTSRAENARRGVAGRYQWRFIGRERVCRRGHVGLYSLQQSDGKYYCKGCDRERKLRRRRG